MSLEVVIPTRNCDVDLSRCLKSLAAQVDPVRVIVVDAHSADNTRAVTRGWGAELFDEPPSAVKGSRRAVACNEGIRQVKGRYVAFLDADTEAPPTWSRDMARLIREWRTGIVWDIEDMPQPVAAVTSGCVADESTPLAREIGKLSRSLSAHGRQFTKPTIVESVPGYNSVYALEPIRRAGGFPEDIGGAEDWWMNHVLSRMGYAFVGVPESPVIHHERKTLEAYGAQMRGYGWSRGRLLRVKHHFTPQHAIPTLLLPTTAITKLLPPTLLTTFLVEWGWGYFLGVLT